MEKVAPDIAYRRLKYVSDWRFVEENQRAALAAIVHGISRLDAAGHWGDGTTSASDGQRFAMPQKVLQRTYSTRFNDFALEFYSFVADNYAPFYSRPIECTDRDAPFVLDGALYHERPRPGGALHAAAKRHGGHLELRTCTVPERGRGQARPFGAADLAAVLATCDRPRGRGRGFESEEVALDRGRLDAVIAGLFFMAGMRATACSSPSDS